MNSSLISSILTLVLIFGLAGFGTTLPVVDELFGGDNPASGGDGGLLDNLPIIGEIANQLPIVGSLADSFGL